MSLAEKNSFQGIEFLSIYCGRRDQERRRVLAIRWCGQGDCEDSPKLIGNYFD